MISIYREPQMGEPFVIGADPAEGNDYCAFIALSRWKADVVMVGQSKEESSQLGHELNHVCRWFLKRTDLYPTIAVERNVGSAALYVLKTLNYPELYRMPTSFTREEENGEQYGWSTNSATRPKMLDDLALAIRQKTIIIPSKEIIDELYTFIRHHKTGKPQADVGSHDDLVMALAIAWQVYQTSSPPVVWDQTAWEDMERQERSRIDSL